MSAKKRKYEQPYERMIGPITTSQFTKMQSIMADLNEQARLEALYNLLVLMKKQDEEAAALDG